MTTFHDRAEFEGVMSKLFERLMAGIFSGRQRTGTVR